MSNIEIKKVWEGRMGFNQVPVYEGYVNGNLVVFSRLKWLSRKVAEAVEAGHIEGTGDTVARFAMWAGKNDRASFDRMPESI